MSQQKNEPITLNVLAGFVPGAVLFMGVILIGLPLALSRGNPQIIAALNWKIVLLELLLLATGYAFVAALLGSTRLSKARWRNVLAGIGGVVLLLVFSGIAQGVGLAAIVVGSLAAGMLSVLFALTRKR